MIHKSFGIPMDLQRLVTKGKELANTDCLTLGQMQTIWLFLRLRGGMMQIFIKFISNNKILCLDVESNDEVLLVK